MRIMMESMGHMGHMMTMHTGSHDEGDAIMPTSSISAKSIGRLFNPFRSKSPQPEDEEDHHSHHSHHSRVKSQSGDSDHGSLGDNKVKKTRSLERHASDGNASVPTIELGSYSESYDANTTLGQ